MADTERFTTTDGIAIAYRQWGARDGAPVILHHGFAADSERNWTTPGVTDALVRAGRWVVALDARGHGESDKPHDPAMYGETRMATDVSTLADVLGLERFDLVGYSMGAIVSLIVASTEPRVRRLIAGGIGGSIAETGRPAPRHPAGADTATTEGDEARAGGLASIAVALRTDDPATITNPVAKMFRAFAEGTGADRLALAAQADARHVGAIALDQIRVPTLVIVGDRDDLAARPEVLTAAISGAELRRIPGTHLSAVSQPEFAAAIVEFVGVSSS